MFRTILVPVDGSALAESALAYADALATAQAARLVLVRAVAEEAPRHRADAQTYLSGLESQLAARGRRVETAVVQGSPAEAILAEAQRHGAQMIVMSTHGRSRLGRWVFGSVTEPVIEQSSVPVLLVPNGRPVSPLLPFGEHPRLLVPLDGGSFAEAALAPAAHLARALGAGLVLLHSVPATDRVLTADGRIVALLAYGREAAELEFQIDLRRKQALDYLGAVADRLPLPRPQIQLDVRVGPPAESIAAAGREHSTALAIMASHARSGLGLWLFGSVARGVLHHASTPLLLLRPPRRQRGRAAAA